jgi:hypothetical protein
VSCSEIMVPMSSPLGLRVGLCKLGERERRKGLSSAGVDAFKIQF